MFNDVVGVLKYKLQGMKLQTDSLKQEYSEKQNILLREETARIKVYK